MLVDEVLLTYFRAPHSYTGQDLVELSGHGGATGVRELLRLALAGGARPAERGELTLRAFLAGKLDLAQAEAVADAVRARTPAALSLAVEQLGGRLSSAVGQIRRDLMHVYARLEATIDFAEDDVPAPSPAELLAPLHAALATLDRLLATARAGALYREGLRVALVGAPNAGKSSLLNALLGIDRAIVTPVAGTTRDVIEESLDLGGIPAVLADTAGIADTADLVERLGVERSRAALTAADVVVLVIDGSVALDAPVREVASLVRRAQETAHVRCEPRGAVVVLNKADLPLRVGIEAPEQLVPGAPVVRLSARTGAGLPALREALERAAGSAVEAEGARRERAVVSNARHRRALEAARTSLVEAIGSAEAALAADFISIDLRAALHALGEVTGESVTEDLLTAIFSQFCIGK